jgi:hypothetical protein
MEKCSTSERLNQGTRHIQDRPVADAIEAGALVLCETCLTQLTHKGKEKLQKAGYGPCPKCKQPGNLSVIPQPTSPTSKTTMF